MTEFVGRQLGNYRLTRLIGSGGFADVYVGEHVYLDIRSAIKVLKTRLVDDEQEHFLQEARTVARLIHPNIVRVLDYGVEGGMPFLVMDYAPNGTLRHRIHRGTRLSPQEILPYLKQVASALQYAHEQNVVHRDVKPENMLIGRSDEVLLSDFGIAVIAQTAHFQSTQEVIGTVAYMAPEQIRGKPEAASDQYSLGMIVYEWLAGDLPFHGSFAEVCSQQLFADPAPLQEKVPGLTNAMRDVVQRAIEKDPARRFPTIHAFADAFAEACEFAEPSITTAISDGQEANSLSTVTAPVDSIDEVTVSPEQPTARVSEQEERQTAYPPTVAVHTTEQEPLPVGKVPDVPPSMRRTARKQGISRRSLIIGLGAGVAALAIAGGVAWLIHEEQQPAARPSVFTPRPVQSPRPVGTTVAIYKGHTGSVYALSWSLSGQYIASGGEDTTVQVWSTTSTQELYTYRGHAGLLDAVFAVAWSPDIVHIASGSADKTVQIWDAATGNHALIYRGQTARILTVSWSPDGKTIASGGADKTVQVWGIAPETYLYSYFGHTATIYAAPWSPDGHFIASGSADKTVQVWESATGKRATLYRGHTGAVYSIAWSPDGKYIVSGSADRTVQVWEAESGKQVYTYHGHTSLLNTVSTVAWSPTRNRIASGSTDKTVHVWDATTGDHVYIYKGHTGSIYTAQWSPDATYIASAGGDSTVRIWQAK